MFWGYLYPAPGSVCVQGAETNFSDPLGKRSIVIILSYDGEEKKLCISTAFVICMHMYDIEQRN